MKLRIIELEDGLDPDEWIKKYGAPAYEAKVDHAMEYYSWLTNRIRGSYGNSAEARMRGFKDVLYPKLKLVQDRLERAAIAHEAAAYLGLDAALLLEEVRKAPVERTPQASAKVLRTKLPANERILLYTILKSAEAADSVLPQLRERGLAGFVARPVFEAVLASAVQGGLSLDEVEGRLDGADRALLHEVVFADEVMDGMSDVERAQACLAALSERDIEARVADIRRKIKDAERSGDLEQALRWTRELQKIRAN
jgi:DNA primase